jgi:hypothetical protein
MCDCGRSFSGLGTVMPRIQKYIDREFAWVSRGHHEPLVLKDIPYSVQSIQATTPSNTVLVHPQTVTNQILSSLLNHSFFDWATSKFLTILNQLLLSQATNYG